MGTVDKALRLGFILSATDKMSRVVDEAVKKSSTKLTAFERTASKAGGSMMKAGGMMTGVGAAIGAATFGIAKSTAEYGASVWDASQKTGVGVEEFQKLAYAAKIEGVEQEELIKTLGKLSKKMVEAASGSETAGQVFKDLGINLKNSEGNLRAPNEIFEELADTFEKVKDGPEEVAFAIELLGKSGADLIPLLNNGKEGLEKLGEEAVRAGLVITNNTAKAGDDFCDSLEAMQKSIGGVVMQLGSALMPIFNDLISRIQGVISQVQQWFAANSDLAGILASVATTLSGCLIIFGVGTTVIGALTFTVGKLRRTWEITMAIFTYSKKVIGFLQVAIAGMRGTTIAANSATRAYMITQGVATKQTKAYIIGEKLAAAATWIRTTAVRIGTAVTTAARKGLLLFKAQNIAMVVAQTAATVAQWLFNTALYACPVVWIIAAIVAIIAIIVLMVKYWDEIAAFFKMLWDNIKKGFAAAWEGIKSVWGKVTGWFSSLWDGIKNIFSSIWEGIKNVFSNYTPHGLIIKHWDGIKAWFAGLWNDIKKGVVNAWNSIGEFFVGLKDKFFGWGKDLITGLWDGIISMVTKVVDGVTNIGKKIANGFKSFFGINSPSRLFMDYGVNITQGLVGGLHKGEPSVEQATSSVSGKVISGFEGSMTSNTVGASNVINSSGGVNVTYSPNITIEGTMTPQAEQNFIQLLKQHSSEIVKIIDKESQNKSRLAFN